MKKSVKSELIYFVRCADLVKIGYTKDIDQRMRDLRSEVEWSGAELELLLTFPGDLTMEAELHRYYKRYRVKLQTWSEWFHLRGSLKTFLLSYDCEIEPEDRLVRYKTSPIVKYKYQPSAKRFWVPSEPPPVVLQQFMEKNKLGQSQIAKVLQCNQSNVSHILNGRQQLTAMQIDSLARFFNVQHSMFFGS